MISRRTPRLMTTKQGRTPEHSPTNMFISRTHRVSQTPPGHGFPRRVPTAAPDGSRVKRMPLTAAEWDAAWGV